MLQVRCNDGNALATMELQVVNGIAEFKHVMDTVIL